MCVKNDFKVSKILKSTALDDISKKLNVFVNYLQLTMSLKEIRQGKKNDTQF